MTDATVSQLIAEHTIRAVEAVEKIAHEAPKPATGYAGFVITSRLPEGWAQITYFPRSGSDRNDTYLGPVLDEDDWNIRIEVWDSPMTFSKTKCIIDRPPRSA